MSSRRVYGRAVASVIKNFTFDAADALVLATLSAAALGSDVDEDSTPDRPLRGGRRLRWAEPVVRPVARAEDREDRLHFELRVPGTVADEVARLRALGASVVRAGDRQAS